MKDRLESLAPDVSESPAAVALRALQEVAREALPEESAELFAVLLAQAVGLDMATWGKLTAEAISSTYRRRQFWRP